MPLRGSLNRDFCPITTNIPLPAELPEGSRVASKDACKAQRARGHSIVRSSTIRSAIECRGKSERHGFRLEIRFCGRRSGVFRWSFWPEAGAEQGSPVERATEEKQD